MKSIIILLLLACGCVPPLALRDQALATSTSGMVVSAERHATQAGVEMLRRGGHAVDAAIAVAFALAVTWPEAGNLGGGGFMHIREATGDALVVDYREKAPAAADPKMFLDASGNVDPDRVRLGFVVAGVPGTIAGLARAHELFGELPWRDLVEPAIRLARDGFTIDERIAAPLRAIAKEMTRFPATAAIFYPAGKPLSAGQTLVQPDLAAVLEAVAADPRAFYEGPLATRMAERMHAEGGLWTAADLAAYRPVVRPPLRIRFHELTLLAPPPPSSAGVALGQMLGMLEEDDLRALGQNSPATLHLLAEVMRRAFLERALHLGDADFVAVDIAGLLSRERTRALRATIAPDHASKSVDLAPAGLLAAPPDGNTTHFSVVDGEGNAVSNTYTLEESYGSRAVLPGFGFLLNNELHDFNVKPGTTDDKGLIGTPPNTIAPGKRPLSSMAPCFVERDGQLVGLLGSPGGRTIINTVLQVFLNLFVFDMTPAAAVSAPRIHHQWMPDVLRAEEALSIATRATLRTLGHAVETPPPPGAWGHANTIVRGKDGAWTGAVDPRRGGHAEGP